MRIIPAWLREFVEIAADDRQLAEDLTSAGIAVESVEEEHGSTFYEMDLTTNRVDAMNHYGVAREASAIYDVALKPVKPKLPTAKAGPSAPASKGGTPAVGMTSQEADAKSDCAAVGMTGQEVDAKSETAPVGMTSMECSIPYRHRRPEGLRALYRAGRSRCEDRHLAEVHR